ncbi:MAG: aspartate-semialdehyde dehydrogenase [Elusimicrobia bacterium]|nr:aspartate-semialdehyde dehydrogenase [Elusimicrobiota bacterium]
MPLDKPGLRVGVVGATGMVGRELLHVLDKTRLPIRELRPYSSGKTGKTVRFRGKTLAAPSLELEGLRSCDLVFFVSSDEVSKEHAPDLARRGVWVIDDSSAFRLDPKVPLVIPEVNAHALSKDRRLIAGPNCTMTPLAVAGNALHRSACVTEVRLATYQAVSGAGRAALEEFFRQTAGLGRLSAADRAPVLPKLAHSALPRPIACNVIPQVGSFDAAGASGEERKVAAELRKVWDAPRLKVSVTAVRVPVVRGHSMSAWLTFKTPLSPGRARKLLARSPGLVLHAEGDYPTPALVGGKAPVHAGRVRRGATDRELCLWLSFDNLLKGAALNSVQIAEELFRRGWL